MNTRLLTLFVLGFLFFVTSSEAQINFSTRPIVPSVREGQQVVSAKQAGNAVVAALNSNPLPASVAIPGSTPLGIDTKYQTQTDGRSMHNIQVDPSNPMNIHALVMSAPNVTEADTVSGGNLGGVYATRNCFYTFSADGGKTWKTPIAVTTVRSGFCDMILYNNGANYVPIIALHRWQSATNSATIFTGVYIEQGAPGTGNFKENLADNIYTDGSTQNIIWPRIAISPDNTTLYVAASVSPATGATAMDITMGTFTLGEGGKAVWNGWKKVLDDAAAGRLGSTTGHQMWASANYAICVAPSGKIGLAWNNSDLASQDLGIYFAESSDKGATWVSTYRPIWNTTDSSYAGTTTTFLHPSTGLDMFYGADGKVRLVCGIDWEQEASTNNSYIPNSGGIMIWKGDTNAPAITLLSKLAGVIGSSGATGIPPTAIDSGAFLSLWPANSLVDPQGANVQYPTFAQTTNLNKYSVFFECWANNDSELVDGNASPNVWYPYHSIYQLNTSDDGVTWSPATAVLWNDTNATAGTQKYDYRFPETSTYNPSNFSNLSFNLMYMGDTAAGLWLTGGKPVWDDVSWYVTQTKGFVEGVQKNNPTSFSVSRAFPNPFSASTSIAFSLKNESSVQLTVADALGRNVANLLNNKLMSKGSHSVALSGSGLPNGVYFYTLRANGETFTQRMVLAK